MEERREDLEAWLSRAAGASHVDARAIRRLSGGAIQENWAIDAEVADGPHAGTHPLVMRADAPGRIAASLGRPQEFALLRAAFDAGVTVPEPLWLCEDESVIGRPFFVMRRLSGEAAGHRLVKDDGLDGAALARSLGRELARIHGIAPTHPDLAFLGEPPKNPALERVRECRAWLDGRERPRPALEWGLRWLEVNAPEAQRIVLCHNDFRTGNYMVRNGQVTGVLDWEFAGWGDPAADLGWFTAPCWRFGALTREAGGIGPLDAFLAGYEGEGAVAPASLFYWQVMATARWAVIALQQAARHRSGEETSLELALTAHIVPELELDLMSMTEKG